YRSSTLGVNFSRSVTTVNMPFPDIDPEEERRRIDEALRPVVAAVLAVVNPPLPDETGAKLERIADDIRAKPSCVARLLPQREGLPNWYLKFGNGVSWSLREGLGASYYHAENVASL